MYDLMLYHAGHALLLCVNVNIAVVVSWSFGYEPYLQNSVRCQVKILHRIQLGHSRLSRLFKKAIFQTKIIKKQNWFQFVLLVKATTLKQWISQFSLQTLNELLRLWQAADWYECDSWGPIHRHCPKIYPKSCLWQKLRWSYNIS